MNKKIFVNATRDHVASGAAAARVTRCTNSAVRMGRHQRSALPIVGLLGVTLVQGIFSQEETEGTEAKVESSLLPLFPPVQIPSFNDHRPPVSRAPDNS